MATYKRGRQYWGEKEEALCQQWATGDTKQQFNIYKKLLPRLNEMAEMIMNRYYSVPTAGRQTELKELAVEEVFLRLHKYIPNKGSSGAYSFCSLVIKHYLHDTLVMEAKWHKNVHTKFDYFEDVFGEEIDREDIQPISFDEYHIDKEKINLILNKKKEEVQEMINQRVAGYHRLRGKKYMPPIGKPEVYMMMLDKMIEYFNKFDSYDGNGLIDYIHYSLKLDLKKESIIRYFKKLFDIKEFEVPIQIRNEGKVEKRYNYFEDDRCPNEISLSKNYRRKKKYGNNYPIL